ncbi:elongation factor P maturation arginine rhamnosyltransferase EarP [Paludibacterium denitrificans]|nr:elongation factor P maturation arginine rhamnosyltransferase EarP [Paludibacterium denitrificans]
MHTPPRWHWDLFCTVIDNYGDIGVARRLARLADTGVRPTCAPVGG